jgi:hypothetical protein
MAISNASDFKVYNEQMQAGYIETAMQFSDAFNKASNGAIQFIQESKLGDYEKAAFFSEIAAGTLITRQDITSNSAVTPLKLSQAENIRVKVHRKIGPIDSTFKAFNMIGEAPQKEFSFQLGQAIAKAQPVEMLNSGLTAVRAAIVQNSTMLKDVTGTSGTCTHANLINSLRLLGDAYSSLKAWVMHSQNFFDLGLDAVSNSVDSVAAGVIRVFEVPSLGVPVVVTDSASLIVSSTNYHVLGLTEGGLQLVDSEATNVLTDVVTGNEQLQMRIQGEGAYNIGVKGFQWDITNGGANPNATNLGTGSNWDKVATDDKSTAGVALKCVLSA